jgi:hypothetical protein
MEAFVFCSNDDGVVVEDSVSIHFWSCVVIAILGL